MTDEPAEARRRLTEAYRRLLDATAGRYPMRPVVADSWRRCAETGAGGDREGWLPPVELADDGLAERRSQHPLAPAVPLLDDLLGGDGHIYAVTDTDGTLLWVGGDPLLRRRAEGIHFLPGACWAERLAGTNAPGTALTTGKPVRIDAAEHYNPAVHPWSCSATPVRDPATGRPLGALDVTGGPDAAGPYALGLVRAAARAVQARLRPGTRSAGNPPYLAVLGRDRAVLTVDGCRQVLSPRYSEILVVLAAAAGGMTAERIAVDLSLAELSTVTVRAQISRLRGLLGADLLASRPYALRRPLAADYLDVRDLITAGRTADAVRLYPGPLLPSSDSPAVTAHRISLEQQLRGAVLASRDPTLLRHWTQTPWGSDDTAAWRALADSLPAGSAPRAAAAARARGLHTADHRSPAS